jgi:hypothetical protein
MSETTNHKILKIKAVEYLYQVKHCKYVCPELKIGDYIFDTIGTDGTFIYIIEAKQDHGDFLSDCNKLDDIRTAIQLYKKELVETGDMNKYKPLIEAEQNKSYKMFDPALFRLASERYIIAPQDLIKKTECPPNWGLLEVDEEGEIIKELACEATRLEPRYRDIVIKEIARRQTKNYLVSIGVKFDERVVEFPHLLLEQEEEE